MFMVITAVLLAPKVLNFANRVIEEYVLEPRVLRAAQAAGKDSDAALFPRGIDLAITRGELKQLKEMGALDIIGKCAQRHYHIVDAAAAAGMPSPLPTCDHCQRLSV